MFSKLCAHCSQMVHSHSDYSKYAIVHDMNSAVTTPNYVSATPLDVDNKIYLQNVHCVNKNANSESNSTVRLRSF